MSLQGMDNQSNNRTEKNIDKMLKSAESIINQDIEEELDLLNRDSFMMYVNPEKYEKAKTLYEKVLSLDPENKRAKEGFQLCDEMLTPYIPVQHLAIPPTMQDLEEVSNIKDLKPWEFRRQQRAQDARGLAYTGEIYSKAEVQAKEEILKIVDKAKKEVETKGRTPHDVYKETLEKLNSFQENLHRGWKGHGPEILEFSIKALKDALDLKEM